MLGLQQKENSHLQRTRMEKWESVFGPIPHPLTFLDLSFPRHGPFPGFGKRHYSCIHVHKHRSLLSTYGNFIPWPFNFFYTCLFSRWIKLSLFNNSSTPPLFLFFFVFYFHSIRDSIYLELQKQGCPLPFLPIHPKICLKKKKKKTSSENGFWGIVRFKYLWWFLLAMIIRSDFTIYSIFISLYAHASNY